MTCPGCDSEIKTAAVMGVCRLPGCASCGLIEYRLCAACAAVIINGNNTARSELMLRIELNLSDPVGGAQ